MGDLYCVIFLYAEKKDIAEVVLQSGESAANCRTKAVQALKRDWGLGHTRIVARVVYTNRDPAKASEFHDGFKKAMVGYGRSDVRSADTGRGRRDSSLRPVV